MSAPKLAPMDDRFGSSANPSPDQMVDALHTAFGDHHVRAVHAKGVMARGLFEPSREAVALFASPMFLPRSMPVLARFSDFTGLPAISDTSDAASPRGFAFKVERPTTGPADFVSHSFNGFPTATSEEFRELLLAIGASGPDAPKPTPLDLFLADHPVAKAFLTHQKRPPVSYATLSYFGVNTFVAISRSGARRLVRFRYVPAAGERFLTPSDRTAAGPDYLQTELPARLAHGPVVFDWYAQVAEPQDPVDDPSQPWPEDRRLLALGRLRLTQTITDPAVARATMFDPTNLPAGLEPADPMLAVRAGAYPISFHQRQ